MATHVAPARPLPPFGAVLLCLERGSTAAYPVTVERHLGQYFFAGGHRFHVYDDWKVGTTRHTWRTASAMVWLASPEEQAAATMGFAVRFSAACIAPAQSMTGPIDGSPTLLRGESQWRPPAPPAGPPEPTECW